MNPNRTSRRRGWPWRLLTAGLVSLLAVACQGVAPPDPEVDRQEIEATLREYLPRLAEAYATGNIEPLKVLTVEKEIARIRARAQDLADQGQVYEPDFKEMTIEQVSVWQYANAAVTTLEVWDVRAYAIGSHTLLNEATDRRNRVKYQLKRKDHGWVVLYRELFEDLSS